MWRKRKPPTIREFFDTLAAEDAQVHVEFYDQDGDIDFNSPVMMDRHGEVATEILRKIISCKAVHIGDYVVFNTGYLQLTRDEMDYVKDVQRYG